MSATRTTGVWHEWKILIFITTRVKTYFHTPILAIWQMKDYKERNNFILRTTCWTCLFPIPISNAFEKCTTKTELCNGKGSIKSYKLDCSCKRPCTFPHSYARNKASFLIKTTLYETNNTLFSKNYWKLGKMNAKFWKTFKIKVGHLG